MFQTYRKQIFNQEKKPQNTSNSLFLNSQAENQVVEEIKPPEKVENIIQEPSADPLKTSEHSNLNNLISGIIEDHQKIDEFKDIATEQEIQELEDLTSDDQLEDEEILSNDDDLINDDSDLIDDDTATLPPEESAESTADIITIAMPFILKLLSGNWQRPDPDIPLEKRQKLERALRRMYEHWKIKTSPMGAVMASMANIYIGDTLEAGAERISKAMEPKKTKKFKAKEITRKSSIVKDLKEKRAEDVRIIHEQEQPDQMENDQGNQEQPPADPKPKKAENKKAPYRCLHCNVILTEGKKLYFCSKEHSNLYGMRRFAEELNSGKITERTLRERNQRLKDNE